MSDRVRLQISDSPKTTPAGGGGNEKLQTCLPGNAARVIVQVVKRYTLWTPLRETCLLAKEMRWARLERWLAGPRRRHCLGIDIPRWRELGMETLFSLSVWSRCFFAIGVGLGLMRGSPRLNPCSIQPTMRVSRHSVAREAVPKG